MSQGNDATPLHALGGAPPARTLAQRWVLATQGILTQKFNANHLRVGGMPRPLCSHFGALFLRRDWGVRHANEAKECLAWLLREGHREAYASRLGCSADELYGWDLVRASAVAGWAYLAYHLDLETAWATMVESARELQRRFTSWQEVGTSYGLGRAVWQSGESSEIADLCAKLLAPNGAWDLPWDVDLAGDIPPAGEELPELVVDAEGGGDHRTIVEAFAAMKVAARIRVRPGTYRESVVFTLPAELIAEGDVTIEASDGAPIVIRSQVGLVRGVRLRSGKSAKGEAMHAAFLAKHYLKLVDCKLESVRCGVYAGTRDGFVSIEGCEVESAVNSGVLIENGAHGAVYRSTIRDVGGYGVLGKGDGQLVVEESSILRAVGPSAAAHESVDGAFEKLQIEDGGSNGVEVLGDSESTVVDVAVRRCKGTGALITSSAQVTLEGCVLEGNAGNDLGVVGAKRVFASECRLGGGPSCAVVVDQGGALELEECTVRGGPMPSVIAQNGAVVTLHHGSYAGDVGTALSGGVGARFEVIGAEITGGQSYAIALKDSAANGIVGSRVSGPNGGLYVSGGKPVILRGVTLEVSGTAPALAACGGAEVAFVESVVSSTGEIALAIEERASVWLSRSKASAPDGVVAGLEAGRLAAYGSELSGREAIKLDAESSAAAYASKIEGTVAPEARVQEEPPIAHAPFGFSAVGAGLYALELPVELFSDGADLEASVCAFVVDRLLAEAQERAPFGGPVELAGAGDRVIVESSDLETLAAAAAALNKALGDKAHIGALLIEAEAAELASPDDLDDEDEHDHDHDEDEDEDEEDESDEDDDDDDEGEGEGEPS